MSGLDLVTCGVASVTGIGLLVTDFSRVITRLATVISSHNCYP